MAGDDKDREELEALRDKLNKEGGDALTKTVTLVGAPPKGGAATPFKDGDVQPSPPSKPIEPHQDFGATIAMSPDSATEAATPFAATATDPKKLPDQVLAMAKSMGVELPAMPDFAAPVPATQQERATGRALAKLATASDKQLGKLAKRVIGADSALDVDDLKRMRDILDMMVEALSTADADTKDKLTAMWKVIGS